ncbi:MAG: DUF2029 domain-containing protein [Chloroflexi bacterium]|nr:DUF2029 domain-containing protein [Chloroflexota bacterium]
MKLRWQLAIFCAAHALIFAFFNSDVFPGQPAAKLYYFFASHLLDVEAPYTDFPMEYPPVALLFFVLPRLITSNLETYSIAFTVEMLLFDLLGLFLIAALSRKMEVSVTRSLGIYTLFLVALGPVAAQRFDIVPAIMVLSALYAFHEGRHKTSWVVLALGTMTKLYPVIIAPIFLLYHLRNRQYRLIRDGVVTFAIVTLAVSAPFIALSPGGYLGSFAYHAQRGLQVESTFASFLLLVHDFSPALAEVVYNFGSWNLVSLPADILAKVSVPLILLSLALVYWLFYKNTRDAETSVAFREQQPDILVLAYFSMVAVLAFMVTGKILSPQFLVWLYPLLPVVAVRWRGLWVALVVIALMTYYIYPVHYDELLAFDHTVISVLFLRNLMLAAVLGGLLWNLRLAGRLASPGIGRETTV